MEYSKPIEEGIIFERMIIADVMDQMVVDKALALSD